MTMLILLLLAIACGALTYFLLTWLIARNSWKNATIIQRTNAKIEESKRLEEKTKLRDRLRVWTAKNGWDGDLVPLFVGATLMYALVMLIMIGLGLNAAVAGVLAVAVCFLTVWGILRAIVERKRRLFRRQLLQALTLMASQIEAGSGPKRALEQIVAQLEDPLGEELGAALAQTVASKDLVGALRDLSVRYPSRAFSMFIAAMEIDEMQGGSLAPALRQAAALLSRDFELVEEAQAELSQTRSEFFIVTGIIGFICVFMFEAGGQAAHDAYTSFIGIVILSIFIANFAFGIFRVLKLLSKAKGKS